MLEVQACPYVALVNRVMCLRERESHTITLHRFKNFLLSFLKGAHRVRLEPEGEPLNAIGTNLNCIFVLICD